MVEDPYKDLADRYDWMKFSNPLRDEFFRRLFEGLNIKTVLDCRYHQKKPNILGPKFLLIL